MLKEVIELLKIKYILEKECKISLTKPEYKCIRIRSYDIYAIKVIPHEQILTFVNDCIKLHYAEALYIDEKLVYEGFLPRKKLEEIKSNLAFSRIYFTSNE